MRATEAIDEVRRRHFPCRRLYLTLSRRGFGCELSYFPNGLLWHARLPLDTNTPSNITARREERTQVTPLKMGSDIDVPAGNSPT